MAQRKSVRRVASPASKKSSAKIKKTVAPKSAATKKQVRASTALGKQKAAQKLTSGKKTVGSKKTVATKAKPTSSKGVSAKKPAMKKTITKKNVVKTALKPKAKKPATRKSPTYQKTSVAKKTIVSGKASNPKSAVTKQQGSVSKMNAGSTIAKKVVTKAPRPSDSSPTRSAGTQTRMEHLSPTERYNLGGLFACAIERGNDPEFKRLRAVLRYLDLPSQEKGNLLRLSQGLTIPKLFAEGVGQDKVGGILSGLISFASSEGAYEKKWRDEIRQVGVWLGYFPQQFEQIEQKVLAKR